MPSTFVNEISPVLQDDKAEYIEEYRPYIKFICKKRMSYLNEHSLEDLESFIVLELLTLFPKKYKYSDFDWVTRTVIRRKAIDFTTNFIKRNEDIIFENQYARSDVNRDGNSPSINGHFLDKSIDNYQEKQEAEEIIAIVKDIEFKINNTYRIHFSDWCREFIEVVLELYEYGNECTRDDIMECMGYDSNEVVKFNSKLLSFRNKLKSHLNLDADTIFGTNGQQTQNDN